MESITKKTVKIEVLSPLHIGCGKELTEGIDYLVRGNKISLIDYGKIYDSRQATENPIAYSKELSEAIMEGNFTSFCKKHFQENDEAIFRGTHNIKAGTYVPSIKVLYRNPLGNAPEIPGSSLKGAIRSIIFSLMLSNGKKKDIIDEINDKRKPIKEKCKVINGIIRELYEVGNDKGVFNLMSYIIISDFKLVSDEPVALYNTNIFDLCKKGEKWIGGWKDRQRIEKIRKPAGFNTFYECFSPDKEGVGTISLRRDLLERIIKEKKYYFLESFESLFYSINKHTADYIDKEIEFFTKYQQAEETLEIIKSLKDIKAQIPTEEKPKVCVLKMSAGSGFHSITGDWMYDNHIEPYDAHPHPLTKKLIPYKTRKIVELNNHLSEMGFVKLTMI